MSQSCVESCSQSRQREEASPSQTIQRIELNLRRLEQRLNSISHSEEKSLLSMQNLLARSVPMIKSRLSRAEVFDETGLKQELSIIRDQDQKARNQQMRLINSREIARSRQMISLISQTNHSELKKASLKNQKAIEKAKQKVLLEKQQRREQIQQELKKSKEHIRMFHETKTEKLREIKLQEKEETEQKIVQMVSQVQEASLLYEQASKSESHNEKVVRKMRTVVSKLLKMNDKELLELKHQSHAGVVDEAATEDLIFRMLETQPSEEIKKVTEHPNLGLRKTLYVKSEYSKPSGTNHLFRKSLMKIKSYRG